MSTELETVKANNTSPELNVTSFFGGMHRGQCIQLTQSLRTSEGAEATGLPAQFVTLTEQQVMELLGTLREWLDGETPQGTMTEDRVRDIVEEVLLEKANDWLGR